MDLDTLTRYLDQKPGAEQSFPFGPDALVYKVMDRMFALVGLEWDPLAINLKCDPDRAEVLRGIFPAIKPGYHMNKRHWNTVTLDGSLPDDQVFEMIDDSYALVVKSLKKADRQRLAQKME